VRKNEIEENPIVTVGIPVVPQREHYLDQCLQSVLAQTYSDPYEIIIAQHPGFHYKIKAGGIPENVSIEFLNCGKSLSSKRNVVIENARGRYIVNIDDDVVPEPDWLVNMVNAAIKNDYDIFWGVAKPIYEGEFPESLAPFEMLIGGFHYDRKGELRRKGLIGCNFGFKKSLRHKRGKFVESLGRGGIAVQDGEETLFVAECINPKKGLVLNAVVNHYIQVERLNFSYIIQNRCSNVKAMVLINYIVGNSNSSYLINAIKDFIKAFRPGKHLGKNILLEYMLLRTAIFSLVSIYVNKQSLNVI
jgi:glycosyltransferase involved in cell wall biosynthesis